MKVIHVAAELAPYAKVGGLGDVVQGLCHALALQGHDVHLFLPAYSHLTQQPLPLPFTVTLVETDPPCFDRPHIYGYPDDVERFAHFSLEVARRLRALSFDVLHLHDWHVALLAALFPRTVLTLHNLAYIGACDASFLQAHDLPLPQEGDCSLLRLGIEQATALTTVSPSYAQQILSPEFGYTLAPYLQRHPPVGILNGIDTHYWNPATDPYLPHPFDSQHLEGKAATQQALLTSLQLKPVTGPLTCAITRLVWQKGPELISALLESTLERGGTFILIGSVPDTTTRDHFLALQQRFPRDRLFISLDFDEALSHRVYGAADLLVVPSRFEPCGLTQLIALHYGTLPLVRATGGLADTITENVNGFVFHPFSPEAALAALDRAWNSWNTPAWRHMQRTGLTTNFSWSRPAQAYASLYASLPCSGGHLA